jgi:hypothetical protein
MLDENRIKDIVAAAAAANLSSKTVLSVTTGSTTDSRGEPALKITIVITPNSTASISGEAALATLSDIQQSLEDAGEERFPIIEYATEEELKEAAD